jgi:hypothetical protein
VVKSSTTMRNDACSLCGCGRLHLIGAFVWHGSDGLRAVLCPDCVMVFAGRLVHAGAETAEIIDDMWSASCGAGENDSAGES